MLSFPLKRIFCYICTHKFSNFSFESLELIDNHENVQTCRVLIVEFIDFLVAWNNISPVCRVNIARIHKMCISKGLFKAFLHLLFFSEVNRLHLWSKFHFENFQHEQAILLKVNLPGCNHDGKTIFSQASRRNCELFWTCYSLHITIRWSTV